MNNLFSHWLVIKCIITLILHHPTAHAQNSVKKNTTTFVIDSARIGDVFYPYGEIKSTKDLVKAIDNGSYSTIFIFGVNDLSFMNICKVFKVKEAVSLIMSTKDSLALTSKYEYSNFDYLSLEGFVIPSFYLLVKKIKKNYSDNWITFKKCRIYKFTNWSNVSESSFGIFMDSCKLFNPSFVGIHNNVTILEIKNSNLTYIDSPDIYKLNTIILSGNNIISPPVILETYDFRADRIDFSRNKLLNLEFISKNFPDGEITKLPDGTFYKQICSKDSSKYGCTTLIW